MGKRTKLSKVLAVVLSLCICMSATAFMSFAYDENFVSETHEVFSRTTSTIAPGVTQDIVFAYANDGKQMAYYVATADITRDDVNVYANYKDNQCTEFGMAKLTEQMASAQAKHSNPDDPDNYIEYYNVVAGVNADFYNMTTGQPTGAFVMEGTITNNANNRPYFAILKDGTPTIGANNADWALIADQVQEAVGGSQVIVKDGVDVTATVSGDYNTDRHSRTCVGYTADGKVVMMLLDGRQEPFSCGGSMHELAQIMLEAGCVAAINLDGGGSATFAAKQEGANEVTIVNRPSDGSERSISSSLMIVSTTPPSDVFDRAVLTAENTYVTPGSTVAVAATGVSPAGTAAEIPADVSWQLADASLGSVENGVFTSNGTVGEAVVQMVYNGAVVGETTINVVIPDSISFNSTTITVPYGKTVPMALTAAYGLNEVAIKTDDFIFTLEDAAVGTFDGMNFTACEENAAVTGCAVTAAFAADTTIAASATIVLGKGSEILQDFENAAIENYRIKTIYPQYGPMGGNKDENGNYYYNGQNEVGSIELVTAENGQVKNGDTALAVTCDYTQPYETGYLGLNLTGFNLTVDATVQSLGMWMYVPELEEIVGAKIRFMGYTAGSTTYDVVPAYIIQEGQSLGMEDNGWYYFSVDLSSNTKDFTFNAIQFYVTDRDFTANNYKLAEHSSITGKFTFYIDDITVDYSSAVDDREAPVFESALIGYEGVADAVALNGQTISENVVSVSAKVADDTTKTNYTGLDISTAKIYVDGVEAKDGVACTSNGVMSLEDVTLADGIHTFRFEICDNMGNRAAIERQINIAANSGLANVTFVPEDAAADKLPIGSIYWMNLKTNAVEDIQSVSTIINLNSVSSWELEGMEVAEGFEAEYSIDEITNNATITVTRTGDVDATGEAVLARIPIRTWVSTLTEVEGYEASTPASLWSRKIIWPIDIKVNVKYGAIEFVDGTAGSFSSEKYAVDTELYGNYAELNAAGDYSNKTSWHVHTAAAVDDVAATCTTAGYTGRTFCAECNSVADWGTIVPATGHTYEVTDGVLKCACGEVYNGEYEGKLYIDGVIAEGWVEDSYYVDGVALTGIQLVDGLYYDFGEDGISKGKYNGIYDDGTNLYYIGNGAIMEGWRLIGDDYWFFSWDGGAAVNGEALIDGYNYKFVDYKLVEGEWINDGTGLKYRWAGSFVKNQWFELNGNTYYFGEYEYASTGLSILRLGSNSADRAAYMFTDEGVLVERIMGDGLKTFDNGAVYLANDVATYAGLVQDADGNYYYINSALQAVKNRSYVIGESKTNGLLPAGTYEFGADGKMLNPPVDEPEEPTVKNGLVVDEDGEIRYYVDGEATYAGVVADAEGNLYYINSTKKAVKNCTYKIGASRTNGLCEAGSYEFAEDGKMIIPEVVKNGLYTDEDGEIRYYVNNEATYAGVVADADGNLYYINSTKKAVKSCTYKIGAARTNGLCEAGTYEFGADGKMIIEEEEPTTKNGLVVDEDGEIRYYVDGEATYAGIVADAEGNLYYINSTKKAVKNCTYKIGASRTNGLCEAGSYEFGADGKMIIA